MPLPCPTGIARLVCGSGTRSLLRPRRTWAGASERDDADVVSQDSRSPSPCLLARESRRASRSASPIEASSSEDAGRRSGRRGAWRGWPRTWGSATAGRSPRRPRGGPVTAPGPTSPAARARARRRRPTRRPRRRAARTRRRTPAWRRATGPTPWSACWARPRRSLGRRARPACACRGATASPLGPTSPRPRTRTRCPCACRSASSGPRQPSPPSGDRVMHYVTHGVVTGHRTWEPDGLPCTTQLHDVVAISSRHTKTGMQGTQSSSQGRFDSNRFSLTLLRTRA